MTACPDQIMMLHGLIDGELDAANALRVEAHLASCPGCAAEQRRLMGLRATLATPGVNYAAPPSLHDRVARLTAQERPVAAGSPPANLSRRWLAGGGLAALAASLTVFVAGPRIVSQAVEREVVAGHVRSLLADHLTDVATSDRHVVKPWFNGRLDFAPPVIELAQDGYPLVGGRLDYLGDHVVAALVYRSQRHTINLFIRPANALSAAAPSTAERQGYILVHWTAAGLDYWAVSDVQPDNLRNFRRVFEAKAIG